MDHTAVFLSVSLSADLINLQKSHLDLEKTLASERIIYYDVMRFEIVFSSPGEIKVREYVLLKNVFVHELHTPTGTDIA